MKSDVVLLQVPNLGLVLTTTREVVDQFFKGVDREAALEHDKPIDPPDVDA